MKIYSWNVNGIRAVYKKEAMQKFLKSHKPDILLIQEIKGTVDKFTEDIIGENTLRFFHSAEKAGYAGTAIFVNEKIAKQIVSVELGIKSIPDNEGRLIKIELKDNLIVVCLYMVNGGKSPEAYQQKLLFFENLAKYIKKELAAKKQIVLGGDFNVAHTEIDLVNPEKHLNHTHFNKEIREHMDLILDTGLIDTYRERNEGKEGCYTYWDNFSFSLPRGTTPREVNKGWRLDYLLTDKVTNKKIKTVSINSDVYGSDHCPIGITY